MSDSLSPWIRDYAQQIAETYGSKLSSSPRYDKKKKVQLIEFVRYGTEEQDQVVWGWVSDKHHSARIRFSRDAVSAYSKNPKFKRHMNLSSAIISIKNFRLDHLRVPTGTFMSKSEHLVLDCDQFDILGSMGEAVFGTPHPLEEDKDMALWIKGLGQGVSGGDVLKKRKNAAQPVVHQTKSNSSNSHMNRVSPQIAAPNRTVDSDWNRESERAWVKIKQQTSKYASIPLYQVDSTSTPTRKRKRISDMTMSQKARVALDLSSPESSTARINSVAHSTPAKKRTVPHLMSPTSKNAIVSPTLSTPLTSWSRTPTPIPDSRRRVTPSPRDGTFFSGHSPSVSSKFGKPPIQTLEDEGNIPGGESALQPQIKRLRPAQTSFSSPPVPPPSQDLSVPAFSPIMGPQAARRVPKPVHIPPSNHPGSQTIVLAPNSDTSGSQEHRFSQSMFQSQSHSQSQPQSQGTLSQKTSERSGWRPAVISQQDPTSGYEAHTNFPPPAQPFTSAKLGNNVSLANTVSVTSPMSQQPQHSDIDSLFDDETNSRANETDHAAAENLQVLDDDVNQSRLTDIEARGVQKLHSPSPSRHRPPSQELFQHDILAWSAPSFVRKAMQYISPKKSQPTPVALAQETREEKGKTCAISSVPQVKPNSVIDESSSSASELEQEQEEDHDDDNLEDEEEDEEQGEDDLRQQRLGGFKVDFYNTELGAGCLLGWEKLEGIMLDNIKERELQLQRRSRT